MNRKQYKVLKAIDAGIKAPLDISYWTDSSLPFTYIYIDDLKMLNYIDCHYIKGSETRFFREKMECSITENGKLALKNYLPPPWYMFWQ